MPWRTDFTRERKRKNCRQIGTRRLDGGSSGLVCRKGEEVMEACRYFKYLVEEIHTTEESMKALTVFQIFEGTGEWFDLSKKPIERASFQIFEGTGEWFDLSKKPIERASFVFGPKDTQAERDRIISLNDGYLITDACIGCGSCLPVCPQSCIDSSKVPFEIEQAHCLHCGNCMTVCPSGAVVRRKAAR